MKVFIKRFCLQAYLAWAAVIFVLCATPGRYIPTVSWLEWVSFDKWVHAGIFFVLTSLSLVLTAVKGYETRIFLLLLCLNIIYGGSLEWLQATVFTERSADIPDFAANTAGCLFVPLFQRRVRAFFLS